MPPTTACLRVPTFLGVHTLALSEELTLDGGALRVWTGAAEHHDPTADSATQLLAEPRQALLGGLLHLAHARSSELVGPAGREEAGGVVGGVVRPDLDLVSQVAAVVAGLPLAQLGRPPVDWVAEHGQRLEAVAAERVHDRHVEVVELHKRAPGVDQPLDLVDAVPAASLRLLRHRRHLAHLPGRPASVDVGLRQRVGV